MLGSVRMRCHGIRKDRRLSQCMSNLSRGTSRFTSNAWLINHFESAESRSEVQPMVLRRCFVYRGLTRTADLVDHTRSRRSEQIGLERFWHSGGRVRASRRGASAQIGKTCPSKIRTECCQSLLLMPEAEVLDGVIGPRAGPGSVSVVQGNQRVWMSGVGVWSMEPKNVSVHLERAGD